MWKGKDLSLFISFNGERGLFKELHIPWSYLRAGLILTCLLFCFLALFILDYMFFFSSRSPSYQVENKNLRAQLSQVLAEVEHLNSRLYQIEDLSQKVKVITGLQPDLSTSGIGPLRPVASPHSSVSLSAHSLPPLKHAVSKVSSSSPSVFPVAKKDTLRVYIDHLKEKTQLVREDVSVLMAHLYEKQDIMASTPTIKPAQGWVSSSFGYRQYPFTGEVSLHEGIDIAGYPGSPVQAPGAGVVVFAGYKPGYGKVIVLDHGYQLSTLYGHLSDIMVSKWQKVKRGQVMGAIGNTGNSSGPHLHYEVRISNVPVDPANYMLNNF